MDVRIPLESKQPIQRLVEHVISLAVQVISVFDVEQLLQAHHLVQIIQCNRDIVVELKRNHLTVTNHTQQRAIVQRPANMVSRKFDRYALHGRERGEMAEFWIIWGAGRYDLELDSNQNKQREGHARSYQIMEGK